MGVRREMVVKTELCSFSGGKIYPGHGITYVRADSRKFQLLNGRIKRSFLMKRNPRKLAWTQFYRRLHKKGTIEEMKRKRAKKSTKVLTRGIVGADITKIRARRNEKPEVREAARQAALREIKERKKTTAATKPKAQAPKAAKSRAPQSKGPKAGRGKR